MIAKAKTSENAGHWGRAGDAAERQMAHYLNRVFGKSHKVYVFHDLRLEHDDDVAQIDHLVMHPYGLIIVESKSVSGRVIINRQGEWIRCWGDNKQKGMPSPIQQAKRQGDLLLELLDGNCEQLLDKIGGLIQSRFGGYPLLVLVAISDNGIIERHGIDPPELCKADQICDRIIAEIQRHRRSRLRLGFGDANYGIYRLNRREMERTVRFLLERHTPLTVAASDAPAEQEYLSKAAPALPGAPTPLPPRDDDHAKLACKHCACRQLHVAYGRYGYYFKCEQCTKNTPIDYACTSCGKKGRIRKRGLQFDRVCVVCGREEMVWMNKKDPKAIGG